MRNPRHSRLLVVVVSGLLWVLPPVVAAAEPREIHVWHAMGGAIGERIAMGRAIVREPSVFLFDEPLSNLDAKLRVQMRLEIKKLHDTLKITSVYVTHDQVEAMTLGHRLLVMHAGNVEQFGRPLELDEKPLTTFVAGFIGSPSMNLLAAKLGSDGCRVEIPSGERIPCYGCNEAAERAITLGIRPEHWQLVDARQSMVHLHVDVVEELGVDTLVHGHLGSTPTPLTVRVPGVIKVQAGETLPLAVAPQHVHVFAPASGQRLN